MTNIFDAIACTVKTLDVTYVCHRGYCVRVAGLAERLQWLMKTRGVSARRLGMNAGLSHAFVSYVIRAERSGETPNVETSSLEKIAAAASVSVKWLAYGVGNPEDLENVAVADALPRWRDVPGWNEAELQARRLVPLAGWTYAYVRDMPVPWPVRELTAGLVIDLAFFVLKYGVPPGTSSPREPSGPTLGQEVKRSA